MATQTQIQALEKKLKAYKKRFLAKKYESLDEASTRLMINSFLTEILGYVEFDEIKTEYRISGTYADYVIQIGRKKHFIIEVKSISLDLNAKHLRQATNYAANEGIDWVLLTNGNIFALYRLLFTKPLSLKKVFSHDVRNEKNLRNIASDFILLSKKSVLKKELEKHWERFEIAEPVELSKLLYTKVVVSAIRKVMRQKAGLMFSEDEVLDALHTLITQPIESTKPAKSLEPRARKQRTVNHAKEVSERVDVGFPDYSMYKP